MSGAFYDDGTGLCFWCPDKATTDYMGVPLCDKHAAEELAKDLPPGASVMNLQTGTVTHLPGRWGEHLAPPSDDAHTKQGGTP